MSAEIPAWDATKGCTAVGKHSDKAREVLLDAAEELFARHGIDAVSNRRIAEHAGTANHSAVAYHFGDRDELLRLLLTRHLPEMNRRRMELAAALPEDAEVRDLLACMVLPWIEYLASRPVPSWHARFLFQVQSIPSMSEILKSATVNNTEIESLIQRLQKALSHLPEQVVKGRSLVLGPMVLGISASYEERIQNGENEPNWAGVGYFFVDSCTGMLTAPVTHPDDFISFPNTPYLI
ncbi:TetR/AcrR family transcriptional regulator [Arthrobacter psychrolactophilus]|uniref:TetR/AcrR family transcriptional regulator n=1 Tax=Arthrobacter psychrolactophilus TaxID=92442 RepID=A0A2V5JGE2_9MICC|nr:TetR/AcrR family transcriptional regulator [Arthrobacter psychrolactophilus]